ncbi:MAG: hypothetical protein Q8N88_03115 [Nanoarchaeota archaeon]|nr:hypothetical protein [Nanoarchaeota archaeon]
MTTSKSTTRMELNRYEKYVIQKLRDGASPKDLEIVANLLYCKREFTASDGIKNMTMAKYHMPHKLEDTDYYQDPVYQKLEHLINGILPGYEKNVPREIWNYPNQFISRRMSREVYETFYNLSPELLKLRFALMYGCKFTENQSPLSKII